MRGVLLAAGLLLLSGCVVEKADLQSMELPTGVVRLPELLEEDTCLVLNGPTHLVGATLPRDGSSGASLAVIVLGGDLTVDAVMAAADGESGPHVAGAGPQVARDGDDGGSIVLLAPDGRVHLRHGGAALGHGGAGGSATSDGDDATGGSGGDGGWFVAGGQDVVTELWQVEVGAGGTGGSATILNGDGGDASNGGSGGDAGWRFDPLAAEQARSIASLLAQDCSDVRASLEQVLALPTR